MISEKDLEVLKLIPIGIEERLKEIYYLYDKEDEEDEGSTCFGLIDIFNYGYMMGKRDERAKRKAHR